jgi:hypothetical protein
VSLYSIDNLVDFVVFELGELALRRKVAEGFQKDSAHAHEIEQLGIVVPVFEPIVFPDVEIKFLQPADYSYFGVLVGLDKKLTATDLLSEMLVVNVEGFQLLGDVVLLGLSGEMGLLGVGLAFGGWLAVHFSISIVTYFNF